MILVYYPFLVLEILSLMVYIIHDKTLVKK